MNHKPGKKRLMEKREASEHEDGSEGPLDQADDPKPFWYFLYNSSFWTGFGTVVIACFTAALFVVGCQQAKLLSDADKTQRVSIRAYLFPKRLEISTLGERDPSNSQLVWYVTPIWENSGNTPGTYSTIYTSFTKFEMKDGKPVSGEAVVANVDFSRFPKSDISVGPHQEKSATAFEVDAGILNQVAQSKSAVTVVGMATYRDEFEGKHMTLFCQKIFPPKIDYLSPGDKTGPFPGRITMDCPILNCVDKQCRQYIGQAWVPKDVMP
jgi:hypothetical protein